MMVMSQKNHVKSVVRIVLCSLRPNSCINADAWHWLAAASLHFEGMRSDGSKGKGGIARSSKAAGSNGHHCQHCCDLERRGCSPWPEVLTSKVAE